MLEKKGDNSALSGVVVVVVELDETEVVENAEHLVKDGIIEPTLERVNNLEV